MRSSPAADPLTSPAPPPGMAQQQPTLASFFKGRGTEPAAAAPVAAAQRRRHRGGGGCATWGLKLKSVNCLHEDYTKLDRFVAVSYTHLTLPTKA